VAVVVPRLLVAGGPTGRVEQEGVAPQEPGGHRRHPAETEEHRPQARAPAAGGQLAPELGGEHDGAGAEGDEAGDHRERVLGVEGGQAADVLVGHRVVRLAQPVHHPRRRERRRTDQPARRPQP